MGSTKSYSGYDLLFDIDGLFQARRISIANVLELRLSCTKPSIYDLILNRYDVVKWKHFRRYCPSGHRWIPLTQGKTTRTFDVFIVCLNKLLQTLNWPVIRDALAAIWRHRNVYFSDVMGAIWFDEQDHWGEMGLWRPTDGVSILRRMQWRLPYQEGKSVSPTCRRYISMA